MAKTTLRRLTAHEYWTNDNSAVARYDDGLWFVYIPSPTWFREITSFPTLEQAQAYVHAFLDGSDDGAGPCHDAWQDSEDDEDDPFGWDCDDLDDCDDEDDLARTDVLEYWAVQNHFDSLGAVGMLERLLGLD